MRLAINGFGRIGRTILRQLLAAPRATDIDLVLINDIAPLETCAYLFEYDSTFGPWRGSVATGADSLIVDGLTIPVTHSADLARVDLSDVDVLLDCTGIARTSDVAARGLGAGAGKVLISGPSPAAEITVVLGANEALLGNARIVSNASCTTNGLAPLARVIDDIAGIVSAHMTTIHCYTNSQPMVDAPRGDLARSRAGALSMVPTTSSATHLIDEVLPHLSGRISGAAVRVPTASVSAVDLVVQLARTMEPEQFETALREAVNASQVLGWTDKPLVSSDLRARPESLVIAGPETRMVGDRQVRVFGWYDNEWGFSARMLDIARLMAG
ncbi:glyceraldehyde-3-phosphate dehydrogenase [Ruegeria pomeroyi]|uniref:type I glyceraldehyde-3-phosphate dehydrogenase n=1 Tax=Ruegeria pomeroyi TaxID=89184 RepID=UPI001F1AB4DF|nr:glyceraldehyde 3-phosphate dehydrogenase NAD-binding domain-containing protein [Ruegeria pomeroyi]MCE8508254.1 glyceraldehyde-3-phosphate dehydrogenase [Ruegeria pomeroyi]MCE8521827.1 glyceraldehyde-3-phosphate dehydrogenase [Ruegeria pomeroyi]MCE8526357.1 glyceraldehyde-3-phosphate dehydrogenase [Ruegeria pomeroyi]MCE8534447.1 glyceraldehyde-3-phosphate dehydrogenase [Ruegeria pomeroyi]